MKHLLYLILVAISFSFVACESDDDGSVPLVYNICGAEYTFAANEKTNIKTLATDEIPTTVRSYVAGEFSGYEIMGATSFQTDAGASFIEVTADNSGTLLFDSEGIFLCGDDSFSGGGYGGDDDDNGSYGEDDDE